MASISEPFSLVGSPKAKLLILHADVECSGSTLRVLRSLTSEHVNAEKLLSLERAKSTPLGAALRRAEQAGGTDGESAALSVMRRWFWTRSPDRGFCLTGFPTTRRQALALDDWLETRSETLDAVIVVDSEKHDGAVVEYYRETGLLMSAEEFSPA